MNATREGAIRQDKQRQNRLALLAEVAAHRKELRRLRRRVVELMAILQLYLPDTERDAIKREYDRAVRLRTVQIGVGTQKRRVVTEGPVAIHLARLKRVMLDEINATRIPRRKRNAKGA